MTMAGQRIAPVVKTRVVPLEPEQAFELFTARAGEWWPVATHSIAKGGVVGLRFESFVGGRFVELTADGEEHLWGEVLTWDPPYAFSMTWYPSLRPIASSILEVRFAATEGGTEVVLVHDGWEAFGDEGAARRSAYDSGWDLVLAPYEAAAVDSAG